MVVVVVVAVVAVVVVGAAVVTGAAVVLEAACRWLNETARSNTLVLAQPVLT